MKGKYLRILTQMALCCALVFALAALPGCEGDTGDTGPQGPPGPPGASAELSVEDLASLGLVYASDVTPINPVLDLSKTVSYDSATGAVTVHFFLTDGSGNGIDVTTQPYMFHLYLSDLTPASENPDPTNNPGPFWHQDAQECVWPAMGGDCPPQFSIHHNEVPPYGTFTAIDTSTGEYSYTFKNTLAASDHVIRVTVGTDFHFTDNNGDTVYVANPVNGWYDFKESDPGTEITDSGAELVTAAACAGCHGSELWTFAHAAFTGPNTGPKTCNNCHNLPYMTDPAIGYNAPEAKLSNWIHAIHSAKKPAPTSRLDFSEITYPQPTYQCATCHNGQDANLITMYPSRLNCGICHDGPNGVDFAPGGNHGGGAQANDANCSGCHPPSAILAYHDAASRTPAAQVPEFDVAITMAPPANGQFYVAGEAPVVTVTLKDHATGQPVDPSVYTSPQGAAGQAGGGLSSAELFVYGPRSFAVPVLTTDSTTDPSLTGEPEQGHPLQPMLLEDSTTVPNPDPLVKTDATGYHYQLMAIPANMTTGTYMVQFQGQDYGAVSSSNFVTTSAYKINFQVGTATEQHKVSGDACFNCHGDTRMHATGSHAHNVPFDTDYCLACHDHTGNHGDYIGNRVHAVHSASATGDYVESGGFPRNWIEITFPQSANNCVICHTNPDVPVPQQIYMLACGGCHGTHPDADAAAVVAHEEELNPDADEAEELAQVTREISAAQHMQQNGGDAAVDAEGGPHTLSCLTCHGAGKVADIYQKHNLNKLPPEPTPQP
jgi:OmcA/MtrC family decaheme c-type cytochrome